jgi:hypothetical protein
VWQRDDDDIRVRPISVYAGVRDYISGNARLAAIDVLKRVQFTEDQWKSLPAEFTALYHQLTGASVIISSGVLRLSADTWYVEEASGHSITVGPAQSFRAFDWRAGDRVRFTKTPDNRRVSVLDFTGPPLQRSVPLVNCGPALDDSRRRHEDNVADDRRRSGSIWI